MTRNESEAEAGKDGMARDGSGKNSNLSQIYLIEAGPARVSALAALSLAGGDPSSRPGWPAPG